MVKSNQEILKRVFLKNGELFAYDSENSNKTGLVLAMSVMAAFIRYVKDLKKEGNLTTEDIEKGIKKVLAEYEKEFLSIKDIHL